MPFLFKRLNHFKWGIQNRVILSSDNASSLANICQQLDGVGPVDNRPSTDKHHHFVQNKINLKKNPAYGRQRISRPMRIVAPIPQ